MGVEERAQRSQRCNGMETEPCGLPPSVKRIRKIHVPNSVLKCGIMILMIFATSFQGGGRQIGIVLCLGLVWRGVFKKAFISVIM